MEKIWTKDEIIHLLETNDTMVIHSLIQIYNRQTESEKAIKETNTNNGVGFNGVDGGFMSTCAEFALKRGYLTPKQMAIVRRKLMKYAGQLTKIVNKKL